MININTAITIYNYYTIIQSVYFGYNIISYTYSVYKNGKKIKDFLFKEKEVDNNWIELNKISKNV